MLRAFIPITIAWPVATSLPQTVWVKLNHLPAVVGRFHLYIHKWGHAPLPDCKCGRIEQTADHVLITYPMHRAPLRALDLMVLHDETRCWLN